MEKIKIGTTTFDVDYCKSKTAEQLRKIYNGEPNEVLDELISKVCQKVEKPNNKKVSEKGNKENNE